MTKQETQSPRNKTLKILDEEKDNLIKQIVLEKQLSCIDNLQNKIINCDYKKAIYKIKDESINLLILDPPYNLNKKFNSLKFSKTTIDKYTSYLQDILFAFLPKLKKDASVYICGDWYSSISIYEAAAKILQIRNRITWEREKGRAAKNNYKNCSEDIWFCTVGNKFTFNVEAVKLRRTVKAPYKENGKPKDWTEFNTGKFRDTAPSNFMSDITIPFWSMKENTKHPTQKSEKLIAKLILASSNKGDVVCDPFLGSGTTAVVSKKLKRNFIAFEQEKIYCLWSQKRLNQADKNIKIQGFSDNVFWERNTLLLQQKHKKTKSKLK
jgi:site-specific DNA-methyltransferase (adenine-specific)